MFKKIKEFFNIRKENIKTEFPCQNCLVRASCDFSKPCDKLEMNKEKLLQLFLKNSCCPDCGSKTFHEGPAGGASVNVQCSECGHWFNMALPLFVDRIHLPGTFTGVEQSP